MSVSQTANNQPLDRIISADCRICKPALRAPKKAKTICHLYTLPARNHVLCQREFTLEETIPHAHRCLGWPCKLGSASTKLGHAIRHHRRGSHVHQQRAEERRERRAVAG